VEQPEPHRLLHLGIPVDLDVGAVPEVVQEGALPGEHHVPAGLPGRGQRRPHLVTHGRERPPSRPAVGDELDHPQLLPRPQHGRRGDQAAVLEHPGLNPYRGRAVDEVIHRGPDPQPALPGLVHQHHSGFRGVAVLVTERIRRRRGHPGIGAGRRQLLVREEFGLHGNPRLAV
jgi:hypothetical protein